MGHAFSTMPDSSPQHSQYSPPQQCVQGLSFHLFYLETFSSKSVELVKIKKIGAHKTESEHLSIFQEPFVFSFL